MLVPDAYDYDHMPKKFSDDSQGSAAGPVASFPSFAGVDPQVRGLAVDTVLFRQGDRPFGIFRLLSGQICLIRTTPTGAQVAIHTVRPGELFAEESLFSTRYHCDAIATKASEILLYRKADVTRHLNTQPEELWQFAAELAHRVQGLRTRLEFGQIRSAPTRVMQSVRVRCDKSGYWGLDRTLKQFSEEIGLTHEARYRALARLERDGLIERSADGIRLISGKG